MGGDEGREQHDGEEERGSQVSHSLIPLLIHSAETCALRF